MENIKYSIGIDFGSESGRVLIVNITTGEIKGMHVIPYRHGVITETLPNTSITIPKGSALQQPNDYIEVIELGIPAALSKAGIKPEQIVGLGIDVTSSTLIPVDQTLTPLCHLNEWQDNHHSWLKLWKHHHTKSQTDKIYKLATQRKEKWMRRLGYNISEEWALPKLFEVYEDAPEVYHATTYFIEAVDWLVSLLTSKLIRNNCSLGFKTFWSETDGFPEEFFKELNHEFGATILSKLHGEVKNIGSRAGVLSKEWAEKLGLPEGLPVATGIIDAHSAVLGTGVYQPETFLMVMGTSTCHMMMHPEVKEVPGISGVIKDGILPGLYAYEAGQSAVGDLFGSYVKNHVPKSYHDEAEKLGLSVFSLLEAKASNLVPGENGMFALDWHNGNRSILSDADLSGVLIGLTLHTKPEEIFRAYMEGTAFGAKIIIETFREWGMKVENVVACGGLPQRNALLMQIYADILNMPIQISNSEYAPAIGAAILGAVAAGTENSGHADIKVAIEHMAQPLEKTYYPNPESVAVYETLYSYYKEMHNLFGITHVNLMRSLKQLRNHTRASENFVAIDKN